MWGTTAGDKRKLCGHFLLSALGSHEFSELLHATGPRYFIFMIAPRFRYGKFPRYLIFICCDRFPCYFFHQPAKLCILQPHLKTRRCVGFWISSHPAFRFPWSHEFLRAFGCNRTFRGWGTCRNMRRQVRRCRFRFCHTSFFSFLLLHPFCRRFGAAILSAAKRAEMTDVEQVKKIVSLVTCEITFGQYVCELMFGVDAPNLNLGSRLTLSNNQSRATLWFFDTCLIVGLLPLIIILIRASLPSKTWNIAPIENISR